MLVIDKKPLEKNRNILKQKQRKVSKSNKQICSPAYGNGPPLFPTELDPPPDPVVSWVQNLSLHQASPPVETQGDSTPSSLHKLDRIHPPAALPSPQPNEKEKRVGRGAGGGGGGGGRVGGGGGGKENVGEGDCVSMESMVSLSCPNLESQYQTGLQYLKTGKFKECIKTLESVRKAVADLPNYGEYVIYKRTKNKRTTLSALSMFIGLAWEGVASPRKAIEYCSHSIQQDPGWPVPFSKRSEYFALFEQYLLDSEGCSRDEAARNRARANIIVDPTWTSETAGPGTGDTFTDLQDGLTQAKEGDIVFLEAGFYYREEGFKVHSSCTIIGASTRSVELVSKGAPTLQVCCTGSGGKGQIQLQKLQFRNKTTKGLEEDSEEEAMKSSAAHIYIISATSVTIRDCLFPGGEEGTGGILVAEEAFYQSLLDLECQNPELRGSGGGVEVEGGNLRLFIDFCIFSDISWNAAVHSNNQATVVLSNCEVRDCSKVGIMAEEGTTLNLLNCQVVGCGSDCVAVDTVSSLTVRGCLLASSGSSWNGNKRVAVKRHYQAGLSLAGRSKGTISRSLLRQHPSAISCSDSDLVLEESCVMDISSGEEVQEGSEEGNLQLKHSAVFVSQSGSVVIQKNNFHNCSLVFLLQHGASPSILGNNVETCLIGFICGARAQPRIERNMFHCILMSIGMFLEDSRGRVSTNIFQYVANGLDVHRGSHPSMQGNTYTSLSVPGLSGSLSFDIQRVHSGKLEELEAAEIITFSSNTEEAVAASALSRRKATQERERPCPCCGDVRARPATCQRCGQISYCSDICLTKDETRHRAFCGISLKDMF